MEEIDKTKILKALSAETRMKILKILAEGERTPSFIEKKIGKSPSTIVEHLEKLREAGLVEKVEKDGRKFVFYKLSEKGREIVSSRPRFTILLLISFIALIGSVISFMQYLKFSRTFEVHALFQIIRTPPEYYFFFVYPYVCILLLAISAIGFGIYFFAKKRAIVEIRKIAIENFLIPLLFGLFVTAISLTYSHFIPGGYEFGFPFPYLTVTSGECIFGQCKPFVYFSFSLFLIDLIIWFFLFLLISLVFSVLKKLKEIGKEEKIEEISF